MDYGLWLLVGLLIVIGLVFLLSGRGKGDHPEAVEPHESSRPVIQPVETAAALDSALTPASPPIDIPVVSPSVATAEPENVVATAPEPVEIVSTPSPAEASIASADADDLLKLKGVGPKLQTLLVDLGVTRFAQIAAWKDADIAAIDARLGNFKGRPVRDQWVDQATYLAAGDTAGFEAKYGKL